MLDDSKSLTQPTNCDLQIFLAPVSSHWTPPACGREGPSACAANGSFNPQTHAPVLDPQFEFGAPLTLFGWWIGCPGVGPIRGSHNGGLAAAVLRPKCWYARCACPRAWARERIPGPPAWLPAVAMIKILSGKLRLTQSPHRTLMPLVNPLDWLPMAHHFESHPCGSSPQ